MGRSTIAPTLKEHGVEPAPERPRKTSWQQFLQAHWEALAAADFFTVEVWTRAGLVRVVVLFVIELSTRRVEIAGVSSEPEGAWMTQIGRNFTDAEDGFLVGKRFLIHDRDPLFTAEFRETLAGGGGERALTGTVTQPERLRFTLHLLGTMRNDLASEPSLGQLDALGFPWRVVPHRPGIFSVDEAAVEPRRARWAE